MIIFRNKSVVIAASLLLSLCAAAQTTASSTPALPSNRMAPAARKHGTSRPPAVPAVPQTPPAPPTPEQMPAVAPEVTYRNGQLSIVATNSTLSDILRAVATRTGAAVDAPTQLTGERVAARIGPGAPRDVLSELLTGPRFDYILVGSDDDPNSVRRIILTPNQASPSRPAAVAVAQQQPFRASVPPPVEDDDDDDQPPSPPAEAPAAQAPTSPAPGHRPFMPQQPPDQVSGQPPASGEGGQQVRSPEQMLEQLRRMQQQANPQQANPQPPNPQ